MAGRLGRFQMVGPYAWKNNVNGDNALGALFQKAPQKASNLMVQLLAYNRGKTLDTFLSAFPEREFETDDDYYWNVIGSSRRNIPLVEARDEDGNVVVSGGANVGIGTAPFYVVFGEDWFADGEVIVGNLNQIYPLRILGVGRAEGTNTVYKVETMGGLTQGVPAERLLAGEKFSIEYAPVERELSRKVGSIRFTSPVAMRNEFSKIRINTKVAGSQLDKKLAFGIPMVREDATGKQVTDTTDMWMHYVDWEVEMQFNEYKNNLLAFGTSNRNPNGEYMNFGKSGNVIKQGAGIFEQSEVANTIYYNSPNGLLDLIVEALYSISNSKLEYKDRKFIMKTGEWGALDFNKQAKSTINSGWIPIISTQNPPVYKSVNSPLNPNAVAFNDYQITEWQAPNGVRLILDVDPLYDDPVRNKIMSPYGGPAFSHRFDIWDIGTMDQPNIFKCKVKGQNEVRGYQWGMINPFTGQVGNNNMSWDEDSAEIHRMATLGACVLDPTRTLSIIPEVLQG